MFSFNPIHLAYAVMMIGIIFSFVLSKNVKKDMRGASDDFAIPFVKLSNHICPTPPSKGLLVEELGNGKVRPLPVEEQSGTIRAVMRRANEQVSVDLFARMVSAADEVEKLAGINRTRKSQFSQPINEILLMTHTFLNGCENPSTIDTLEKKRQFDSFLMNQLEHRMVLLKRISGRKADEYRDLNHIYAKDMERLEREEFEAKKNRNKDKN